MNNNEDNMGITESPTQNQQVLSDNEKIAQRVVSNYVRVVDGSKNYTVYVKNSNSGESEWHPVCSCRHGDQADDIEADIRQTIKEAIIESLERK